MEATKIGLYEYVVSFCAMGNLWQFIEIICVSIINFMTGMLRYIFFKSYVIKSDLFII